MSKEELAIVWKLRRVLSGLDGQQALELLLERLKKTPQQHRVPHAGAEDDARLQRRGLSCAARARPGLIRGSRREAPRSLYARRRGLSGVRDGRG